MGIYVDNSATTPIHPQVKEAMLPYLNDSWGNPSSLHELGHAANEAIANARQELANMLGCESEEIYFIPSGTLANNVAILGRARFVEANRLGKHLITTPIEHSAVLGPVKFLESCGWTVTYLPVNNEGFVDIDKLRQAITNDTSIISIGWANNEIGTVQAIEELAELTKETNIFFHTDAIQVPGKLKIDLKKVQVSSLSIAGHKFNAPKGIGALFVRNGSNIMPITFGGGQEQGLFSGTESVANIVGLGKAAQLATKDLADTQLKLRKMQKDLIEKLDSLTNIKFTGPTDISKRLPGHVSLVVPGVNGETLILRCDLHGIYLSSGSACSNKVIQASHVLKAIGLPDDEALGAVRISFGRFNSEAECEELAPALENIFRLEEPSFKAVLGNQAMGMPTID